MHTQINTYKWAKGDFKCPSEWGYMLMPKSLHNHPGKAY